MEILRNKKDRLIRTLIPVGIALAAGWIVLFAAMKINARNTFYDLAETNSKTAFRAFDERSAGIRDVVQYGDTANRVLIRNIAEVYSGVRFSEPGDNGLGIYARAKELRELIADSDIAGVYIVSSDGKALLASDLTRLSAGESIVDAGILTLEQFDVLKQSAEGDAEPLALESGGEQREFFCAAANAFTGDPYAAPENNYVIMECSGAMESSARAMLSDLSAYFGVDSPELEFSEILVDLDTGIIRFGSKDSEALIGQQAKDHGIDTEVLRQSDGRKTLTMDGKKYPSYTAVYTSPELGNFLLIYRNYGTMKNYQLLMTVIMLFITAVVLIITVCGTIMEESERRSVVRKTVGMIVLGEILITAAAFYFASVSRTSIMMQYAPRVMESFAESTEKNTAAGTEVHNFYKQRVISIARTTRSYLERTEDYAIDAGNGENYQYLNVDEAGNTVFLPDVYGHPTVSLPNSGVLEGLCYLGTYDKIRILDTNGRTVACSGGDWHYDVLSGEHTSDAEVLRVLHRETEYYYEVKDGTDGEQPSALIAVPISLYVSDDRENDRTAYHCREDYEKDETGTIERKSGALLISSRLSGNLALDLNTSMNTGLAAVETAMGVEAALVSAEAPHICLDYHPLTEQEIGSLGFTEEDYVHDTYRFTKSVHGKFAMLLRPDRHAGSELPEEFRSVRMLIHMDKSELFRDVPYTVIIFAAVSLLIFAVFFVALIREKQEENREKKEEIKALAEAVPRLRLEHAAENHPSGFRAGAAAPQTSGMALVMIRTALYVAAIILLVCRIKVGSIADGSFFSYMIGKQWPKGLNFYSVSYVLYLAVIIMAILNAAGKIVELVSSNRNPALETVMRLILSVINYAGVLVLLFYSLQMLGVQTGTVITFGGIITGVIGLGANSLISDIIAGLFIIFEREFRVNDIVTIDGFTGVVRGIGLRTTRVQDSGGNVKTFNNSKINGVQNLTENYSTAFATLGISLEVPVETVETLINFELPKRLEEDPDIVEGPWFSGILEIKSTCYTISVGARCEQQKVWKVKKEMTKHLLLLLKENNITIA